MVEWWSVLTQNGIKEHCETLIGNDGTTLGQCPVSEIVTSPIGRAVVVASTQSVSANDLETSHQTGTVTEFSFGSIKEAFRDGSGFSSTSPNDRNHIATTINTSIRLYGTPRAEASKLTSIYEPQGVEAPSRNLVVPSIHVSYSILE
jgi:hypothetical protein